MRRNSDRPACVATKLSRQRPRVRVPSLPPFLIGARATYGALGESSLPSFNIIFSRKRFGTITDA